MEGANEAGRAAANAIIDRSGSREPDVAIGSLWEPPQYDGAKKVDEQLYRAGQPNALDLVPSALPV
jgi:hypothetical protein